jgi:hypothetical protein
LNFITSLVLENEIPHIRVGIQVTNWKLALTCYDIDVKPLYHHELSDICTCYFGSSRRICLVCVLG